ncbi:hypothetical protein F53441_9303 [Fusarium austroafricanum]|uniref:Uncharacterized protein n=1 Tax=Fusarium austroafricanum TaxID=2364996 RepID=A0A8H4KCR9_9HYPO|nr:hypothetical protein F53441_9303 [Fusarium austroafricanum]
MPTIVNHFHQGSGGSGDGRRPGGSSSHCGWCFERGNMSPVYPTKLAGHPKATKAEKKAPEAMDRAPAQQQPPRPPPPPLQQILAAFSTTTTTTS